MQMGEDVRYCPFAFIIRTALIQLSVGVGYFMRKIVVLIIDDHPTVRLGLQAILNRFEDIEVSQTAESGEAGLQLYRVRQPDVVLVDLYMPDMDGIETISALKRDFPDSRLIMLTQSEDDEIIVQAVQAGAMGYLVKTAEVSLIAEAIRAAAAGKRFLSPQAVEAIIRAKTAPAALPDSELTERELDVLTLMVKGLKNPQIASTMHISVSTVKFHIGVIFKKLGTQTRTEAVVLALDRGLVERSES